jgi:hypothetical protein
VRLRRVVTKRCEVSERVMTFSLGFPEAAEKNPVR